ncbi:MAG: glycosyltransferase family 4 protein [Acidimicrobiaceae bacterium]|nr:glycosyltransferase family 4 protein [Acidimicrobiaceae bacterium]
MRIAIIASPWVATPPPAYGGTEVVLDSLATGLSKAGHEVFLFATGDSTSEVPMGYRFDRALGVGRDDATLAELIHVVSAYEMVEGFDIVHDHTLIGPAYCSRYPDLPVVTTNHLPFSGGIDEYYRSISSHVPVIAISNVQAAAAKGINLAAVIYHGIDVSDFPIGDGKGGYALFLGRMSPDKGVHTAIEVARAAGIPLKIAAKCRERTEQLYFDDVVKPMLGSDVEYLGEANHDEKLRLLAGAVCLLNPIAWSEPFGMVMLEALACGTPVIATHAGAAPEIVDDGITGYLGGSPFDLAKAVGLASSLDRLACRKAVADKFSREIMVQKHLEVYKKVIANFTRPDKTPRSTGPSTPNRAEGGSEYPDDVFVPKDFDTFRPASGM